MNDNNPNNWYYSFSSWAKGLRTRHAKLRFSVIVPDGQLEALRIEAYPADLNTDDAAGYWYVDANHGHIV